MSQAAESVEQAVADALEALRRRRERALGTPGRTPGRAVVDDDPVWRWRNERRVALLVARHVRRHGTGNCRRSGCVYKLLGSRNRRWRDEAIACALRDRWVVENGTGGLAPGPTVPHDL